MIEPIIDSLVLEEISDEQYFGSDFVDYVSNSRLSLINPEQGGSEELFLENKHKASSALSLGSAVHCMTLQPDEFRLAPKCSKPTAKLGMMADFLYPYYRINKEVTEEQIIKASNVIDYYKGKMDKKKIDNVLDKCTKYWAYRVVYDIQEGDYKEPIFLDDASYDKCISCLESIKDNISIQNWLHPINAISKNEAALLMDFKYTDDKGSCIIKFKAKLDNFTIDKDSIVLNDLKTTGHYVDQFKDSFEKYHYYRQGACYSYLLSLYAEKYHNIKTIDSFKCNFLLVSTIPEFKSGVFPMTYPDLERGWNEFVDLMNRVGSLYVKRNL